MSLCVCVCVCLSWSAAQEEEEEPPVYLGKDKTPQANRETGGNHSEWPYQTIIRVLKPSCNPSNKLPGWLPIYQLQ